MFLLLSQKWNIVACVFEFEFIGVLRHMQRYFSHILDVTAQMCRRIEEEVVPPIGLSTP